MAAKHYLHITAMKIFCCRAPSLASSNELDQQKFFLSPKFFFFPPFLKPQLHSAFIFSLHLT